MPAMGIVLRKGPRKEVAGCKGPVNAGLNLSYIPIRHSRASLDPVGPYGKLLLYLV